MAVWPIGWLTGKLTDWMTGYSIITIYNSSVFSHTMYLLCGCSQIMHIFPQINELSAFNVP